MSGFLVRFASTKALGNWRWTTSDRDGDSGLRGRSGTLAAQLAASEPATIFTRHGYWSIPLGGRNQIHADGRLPQQAPVQFNSGSSAEPRVVVFTAEGGGTSR